MKLRASVGAGLAAMLFVLASAPAAAAASTPVTVNSITPPRDATGVAPTTVVTATFNTMMNSTTVNATTFELRDPLGNLVPASAHAGGETPTSTLIPNSALASGTRYTATVKGGPAGVKDGTGNTMTSDFSWSFTTSGPPPTPPTCPCTIWNASSTPASGPDGDPNAVELGVRFDAETSGFITGIRFYKFSTNTGTHTGSLWSNTGARLATATFTNESATGWQQATFPTPVAVTAFTPYVASYHTNVGHYAATSDYFASSGVYNFPLYAPQDGGIGPSGVYHYGSSVFPSDTYRSTNYWVDVVFVTSLLGDFTPPTVTSVSPAVGATGVATTTFVNATLSESMTPSTINSGTVELRDPFDALVPATVIYNVTSAIAILRPDSALESGTKYTATLKGGTAPFPVRDLAGNAMAADYSWSFTTAGTPPPPPPVTCPCTIWTPGTTAAVGPDFDDQAVELGLRFRSDTSGFITGVRFYKHSTNTGTHVGSLWTNTGALIARATFTNESGSGWQQVTFPSPVAIAANATYVASYHTNVGHYAANFNYLAVGFDNVPLHALRDGLDGPSGVYRYGAASAFPNQSYGSTNYWVDVVLSTTAPPPTVASTNPVSGAVGVAANITVTATFSTFMDPATVTDSTVSLRTSSGALVPSTVAYSTVNGTAILLPTSPLILGATYTATVKGGTLDPRVKDVAGAALAENYSWSFTIVAPEPPPPSPDPCPCTIWSPSTLPAVIDTDPSAVELGVRFRAEHSGYVTGVRFYKGAGNTGVHVGNLWTNTGTLLATATFSGESGSGWQQVNFIFPVAIAANTYYMVSYHTTTGHYAIDEGYFASASVDNAPLHAPRDGIAGVNGVYTYSPFSAVPFRAYNASNYWVDVVFRHTQSDTSLPKVLGVTPAAGATGVSIYSTIQVFFNVSMTSTTVNSTTFQLRDAAGVLVPGSGNIFFGESGGAVLGLSAPLAYGTTYTVTVKGGSTGVLDYRGYPLASDFSWSFTTVPAP